MLCMVFLSTFFFSYWWRLETWMVRTWNVRKFVMEDILSWHWQGFNSKCYALLMENGTVVDIFRILIWYQFIFLLLFSKFPTKFPRSRRVSKTNASLLVLKPHSLSFFYCWFCSTIKKLIRDLKFDCFF